MSHTDKSKEQRIQELAALRQRVARLETAEAAPKQVEEASQAQFVRLQALTRMNQLISASLDMDTVLGEIARAAARLMQVPLAGFWLADEATRTLELGAFSDERMRTDFPFTVLSFEQCAVGWVATHRRFLNVTDVCTDGRFTALDWWQDHDLQSFFGRPIFFENSLLAVLMLSDRQPIIMQPDDQLLLDSFVSQAAIAIRNAALYEEVRSSEARFRQLAENIPEVFWTLSH